MHLNVVVVVCLLIFLIDGFNGANGNAAVDERCNMQEFLNVTKTQKLVKLEEDYYRFFTGWERLYVGEEPMILKEILKLWYFLNHMEITIVCNHTQHH
uniref:Uncharacterized protein n=1 Tax=Panagrolaimus superbus TaxID=310955 RepID=A0A914Z0T0_9BILA